MAARGIEESDATRTSLLNIFGDTPLGESVMADAPEVPFNAEAPRHAAIIATMSSAQRDSEGGSAQRDSEGGSAQQESGGSARQQEHQQNSQQSSASHLAAHAPSPAQPPPAVLTDVRGLTRHATSILLRQELMRAAERVEYGVELPDDHGGWAVLVWHGRGRVAGGGVQRRGAPRAG